MYLSTCMQHVCVWGGLIREGGFNPYTFALYALMKLSFHSLCMCVHKYSHQLLTVNKQLHLLPANSIQGKKTTRKLKDNRCVWEALQFVCGCAYVCTCMAVS